MENVCILIMHGTTNLQYKEVSMYLRHPAKVCPLEQLVHDPEYVMQHMALEAEAVEQSGHVRGRLMVSDYQALSLQAVCQVITCLHNL